MNMYEAVFIMAPSLEKEGQDALLEDIKKLISKHEGSVNQVQVWGKKRLAYPIKKQNEGTYYLLDLSLTPESIIKLEGQFKLNESILRVMIVTKEAAPEAKPEQVEEVQPV